MTFRSWVLPPGIRRAEGGEVILAGEEAFPLMVLKLTAGELKKVMTGLREAREKGLARLSWHRVVGAVDRVARRLMESGDPLREEALEILGPSSGLTPPMARTVLEGMVRDWTRPRLEGLLASEFSDPGVLDGFRPGSGGRDLRALGRPLTFHLGAGTVPGVGATSLVRALLVKSAVLLKPGRGDVVLPVLLARGLMEEDPEVADSVAVLYWTPEEKTLLEEAIQDADLVVAYGEDATVSWVRNRLPLAGRLVAYRHRMGVGLIGRPALNLDSEGNLPLARDVARAVSLFDQRGCVSMQVILVEEGGEVGPSDFAGRVADALAEVEEILPSGRVFPEEGAVLQQVRGEAEVAEAWGDGFVRHGGPGAPWTVLFQPSGTVVPTCLHRTVRIIPLSSLEEAPSIFRMWEGRLQTVGVAGLDRSKGWLLEALAELGASRIAPFEAVPWPPPWWHHDGEGPLRVLVHWMDVERGALNAK